MWFELSKYINHLLKKKTPRVRDKITLAQLFFNHMHILFNGKPYSMRLLISLVTVFDNIDIV